MNDFVSDLSIINKILHHRLQHEDIQTILSQLSDHDQGVFAEKVGQILGRTSVLLEVSRRVNENLELNVMLPKMVVLISDFLAAERATIFLHDDDHNELFSRVAQGDLNFEFVSRMEEVLEITLGKKNLAKVKKNLATKRAAVGACYESGESMLINDPYSDPRFDPATDLRSGYTTRNVICVPIKHRDHIIGVFQVLNRKRYPFNLGSLLVKSMLITFISISSPALYKLSPVCSNEHERARPY